jgi:hypothetical protein
MDEEVLEAIKSIASEGADLTAVETVLTGYVKDPIGGITDKDQAIKFIRDNPLFNSAFDSSISKAVETNRQKILAEDLPKQVAEARQKFISELNPEETEAQKVAREFAEYKQEQTDKESRGAIKSELLSTFDKLKASELGFKTEDLEPYVMQGEKAVENFVKQYDRFSAILKTRVEEALKGKYNTGEPETGDKPEAYNFNKVLEGQTWLNK